MGDREKLIEAFKSRANEWDRYDFDPDWDYSTESAILADIALAVFEKAQAEPSDAEVKAALDAWVGDDFFADYPGSVRYWEPSMRAALRAAREAADG